MRRLPFQPRPVKALELLSWTGSAKQNLASPAACHPVAGRSRTPTSTSELRAGPIDPSTHRPIDPSTHQPIDPSTPRPIVP
jgi:hypothetical protein